ncbi:hypothetical protein F5B22DRAFT_591053 [Xylaria bambusicola]|uniref:uncharacterized protein n=1 Tax=Xylaria bambusicola TaxID=326684 RepID=UPI0020072C4D|nr:uncharacterized protein F5B22DRAFT_591053 [Xylaria bambusicola]KAI0525688.1 hypothetical protein F5B22DRAFT_591053 [Xylaria bambusicola]
MATPGKNKTNFKTYEASTRLLAAVIATNNVKLDYVELAKHVGGGASKDAINHRLRHIKQLAKMQAACVKKGEDPGDLPADKGEIQKLFGESTPSGIEWQFRDIKNLGKAQQEAVKKGENPATLPVAGTPSGRNKRSAASTPVTGARSRKRQAVATLPPVDSSDENGGNGSDGDIETPSKRPTKKARPTATMTPKTATAAASNTFPTVAAASRAASTSIFGNGADIPATMPPAEVFDLRSVTGPSTIKKEFTTGANPFLGAENASFYDQGDNMEEGEV